MKAQRHTLQEIGCKCDRILGILEEMRCERENSMLNSIRESARDMYQSSLEERRRTGRTINVVRHD